MTGATLLPFEMEAIRATLAAAGACIAPMRNGDEVADFFVAAAAISDHAPRRAEEVASRLNNAHTAVEIGSLLEVVQSLPGVQR